MSDVKLRIDTRYFRMCIHRQALKQIGDPPFINFGYQPKEMRLMVVGSWVDDRKSVRIRYSRSGSVYIFSKPLVTGIRQVNHILMASASYLIEGNVVPQEGILIFPLKNAVITSEDNPDIPTGYQPGHKNRQINIDCR